MPPGRADMLAFMVAHQGARIRRMLEKVQHLRSFWSTIDDITHRDDGIAITQAGLCQQGM